MSFSCYQAARVANLRLRNAKNLFLNMAGNPVVVLGYHRVTALSCDPHSLAVSPPNFRAQMEHLKRNFRIVRFEEDWSVLDSPAVAVTFDDGYADNATEALPVLEELEIPATFFVSSGPIGAGKEFWWDELEQEILGEGAYPPHFARPGAPHGKRLPTVTVADRQALLHELVAAMMRVNAAGRARFMARIREWRGTSSMARPAHLPMDERELESFARSPWVTVGAHTVTHASLSALSEEEQRHEILASKAQLESLLGREITVFSYPFGTSNDYDATSVRLCREAGFRKAATAIRGQFYRWSDPYRIPRHFIFNYDLDTFAVKMKSFWF